MTQYPIFLLPKGEIMMTAKMKDGEIHLLKKTLFPSDKRYAISNSGLTACLDRTKKIIIYGQLTEDGDFDYVKVLPFPSIISPKSICVVKDHLVLGGENNHEFLNDINSHELVVSYSIREDKFTPVDMPYKGYDKCIDDLLVSGSKIIAVDNIVYPKYLLEYDFQNPSYPHLIKSFNLPENGTYESIHKGSQNENFLALISSSFGMDGGGRYVNVFRIGDYSNYIRLSQWYGVANDDEEQEKKYYWRDILLVPHKNVLLISSNDDGVGVYFLQDELFQEADNEDSDSIVYVNNWDKKVVKLLLPPNDSENVIAIFEEGEEDNIHYSYSIESISEIIDSADTFEDDDDYDDRYEYNDYVEPYDDFGDSEYCGACQESPCMCSDRERTSTVHDF